MATTTVSVLFDLDGTLLNTLQDLSATGNEVLVEMGFPTHPQGAYKQFVGQGLANLITQIVPPQSGSETIAICTEKFLRLYEKNWKRNCCPYPGINAMLSALSSKDVKLAVLSNKPHPFTVQFVDEFFPQNPFSLVYGQRDGYPRKPDPAVALEILSSLGSSADSSFFVGDSGVDMQTACNAGLRAVGVTWGFRSVAELQEHHAEILINHPGELLDHVISSS